jgi:hypothetical protein
MLWANTAGQVRESIKANATNVLWVQAHAHIDVVVFIGISCVG